VSVQIPVVAIAFGSVAPSQGDVVELKLHLGCTNEVSSFEAVLQNFDGRYSPSGANALSVGLDGSISVGRGRATWKASNTSLRQRRVTCEFWVVAGVNGFFAV
jgi:hypothetical protein